MVELKTFINGKLFEPYFSYYTEKCIYPQQAHAIKHSMPRPRGPGLQVVERRLLQGECSGDNKFSCQIPDQADWDNIDYCVYMLYGLRQANRSNVQGIFYNKGLTESQMHNRIWALVKYTEYNQAPSRKKQRLDLDALHLPQASADPSTDPPTEDSSAVFLEAGLTASHSDPSIKPSHHYIDPVSSKCLFAKVFCRH